MFWLLIEKVLDSKVMQNLLLSSIDHLAQKAKKIGVNQDYLNIVGQHLCMYLSIIYCVMVLLIPTMLGLGQKRGV